MSAEQAEPAPEGSFAVLRAGRHGLPVFCGSLDEALKVAKTSTEQSGGKYLVLRVLGSVRAEAYWTLRADLMASADDLGPVKTEYRSALRDIEDAVGRERWNPYP